MVPWAGVIPLVLCHCWRWGEGSACRLACLYASRVWRWRSHDHKFTRPKITSNSLLKACTTIVTTKQTHTSAVHFRSDLYISPGSKLPTISAYYSTNLYSNIISSPQLDNSTYRFPVTEFPNQWKKSVIPCTYLLTPCCRVLLQKLTSLQLVKKFPAFHETRRFITTLTSVCHLSLSWAKPVQSIYPHPNSWKKTCRIKVKYELLFRLYTNHNIPSHWK